MSTKIFFMCVATLLVATVSTHASAVVRKAECRYRLTGAQTSPTPASHSPWANPTAFALILASKQFDIITAASTPDRDPASEEYIETLERMLRPSARF